MERVYSEQGVADNEERPQAGLIAAGEVGQFVFCPESWRLGRMTVKAEADKDDSGEAVSGKRAKSGIVEHNDWGRAVDELEAVRVGIRVLFGLCIVACLLVRLGVGR